MPELNEDTIHDIKVGIASEGFPQHIVDAIRFKEYESQDGSTVITLELLFSQPNVMDWKMQDVNPFIYIGRKFAHGLQESLASVLPEIRIGGKVIMSAEEYEGLRRRANSCPSEHQMYDSDFGRNFGTKRPGGSW